ncbi:hypothetical protein HNR06_000939 [Nocardiopsis arvandica]|uniref:CAAX prenyl protease 2/Lysostaphin resistance protein A-like domain-containing protein n=1 Tax=Nocardiopsis sinuspersici TaxID=501010 RepID=A0A7Y9XBQ8_9ACTN|nr:CPBP family glutamic-type intramembrane protease [Nocardiopsis sinuspersici]NYH51350.1 hypothetical protein [Nocardiopsis sinuspersici]
MSRPRRRPVPVSTVTAYALTGGVLAAVFLPPLLLALVLGDDLRAVGPAVDGLAVAYGGLTFTLATALALTWWVTRHLGIGIRDLGLAPTWTREPGLLARMDYQYQAFLVFGGSLALFLLARGTAFLPGVLAFDAPAGATADHLHTLWVLAPAQVGVAVVAELVLLGLVVTLAEAGRRPAWETYAVSTLARLGLGVGAGWAVLALVPVGVATAWLYRRTRRLTPVIAAHATAGLAQVAVTAWVSWISGSAYPPAHQVLLLPHL